MDNLEKNAQILRMLFIIYRKLDDAESKLDKIIDGKYNE